MPFRPLVLAAILLAAPASAQAAGHQDHSASAAADSAATRSYKAANDRMHRDMAIRYTGDPDRDFVAGMIAHHQGAIDMAKVELQHGHDPEIRKLAEGIIAAQQQEIAQMRAWQSRQR